MLKHSQASCSSRCSSTMHSQCAEHMHVRNVRTNEELLTSISLVAVRLARRGAARFTSLDDENQRAAVASLGQPAVMTHA